MREEWGVSDVDSVCNRGSIRNSWRETDFEGSVGFNEAPPKRKPCVFSDVDGCAREFLQDGSAKRIKHGSECGIEGRDAKTIIGLRKLHFCLQRNGGI